MDIKTLEFIHHLLIEAENKTNEQYKAARKLQHIYEDSVADKNLINTQKTYANECMRIHVEALNALKVFENHEW